MVMIEDIWWCPFLFDGSEYFSFLETQINNPASNPVAELPYLKEVPLGVLLSEQILKREATSSDPTSCTWTGGPDSCEADEDQ